MRRAGLTDDDLLRLSGNDTDTETDTIVQAWRANLKRPGFSAVPIRGAALG